MVGANAWENYFRLIDFNRGKIFIGAHLISDGDLDQKHSHEYDDGSF